MNDEIFLFISGKANEYVRDLRLFSNTEEGVNIIPISDIDKLRESRDRASGLIGVSRIADLPHITKSILDPWAQKKLAKESRTGNCNEKSSIAFTYILKHFGTRLSALRAAVCICSLEYNEYGKKELDAEADSRDETIIEYNSHAVVLLYTKGTGEDLESPNPNLWGPDAVVCDPSFCTAFKASEYQRYLKIHKSMEGYTRDVKQGYKKVVNKYELYDPKKHLMKILTDSTTMDAYPLGVYKLKIKRIVDNAISQIQAQAGALTNEADIRHNMWLVLSSENLAIFRGNVSPLLVRFQTYGDIFQRLNVQVDKLFKNVDDIDIHV